MVGAWPICYVFVYIVELFPSHVRVFTNGALVFILNLMSSLTPYFGLATDKLGLHFMTSLFPFAVAACAACFFLPETKDKILLN